MANEPPDFEFPFDKGVVRLLLRAAFNVWEEKYQPRYVVLLPHVARLGLEIGSENDYIKALTVTPDDVFQVQFDELETFVFVHALNELDKPGEYPKNRGQ